MAKATKTSTAKAVRRPVKRRKEVAFPRSDLDLIEDAALSRSLTALQIARERGTRGRPVWTVWQCVVKAHAGVDVSVKRNFVGGRKVNTEA